MNSLLIIQPIIPHYRKFFFQRISELYTLRVLYGRKNNGFKVENLPFGKKVRTLTFLKLEFYCLHREIRQFRPQVIVTYGEVKQLSNLLLILMKPIYKYKLFFWSHGFQEGKLTIVDRIRLILFKLSDGVIFYTKRCYERSNKLDLVNTTYINNTLDINKIFEINKSINIYSKDDLKQKYKIKENIVGIFVSRFTDAKKPMLLLELMQKINKSNNQIGFIIIGAGDVKPDFKKFPFIYDFGNIYDDVKKAELFKCADFFIMPKWTGLSIVEAFANGLSVYTMAESKDLNDQSVEYSYINSDNGYIANSKEDFITMVSRTTKMQHEKLGKKALRYVSNNLTPEYMIAAFSKFIQNHIN